VTACAICAKPLERRPGRGRPATYCSIWCRRKAEMRQRDGRDTLRIAGFWDREVEALRRLRKPTGLAYAEQQAAEHRERGDGLLARAQNGPHMAVQPLDQRSLGGLGLVGLVSVLLGDTQRARVAVL
jgi:hypothetical protein